MNKKILEKIKKEYEFLYLDAIIDKMFKENQYTNEEELKLELNSYIQSNLKDKLINLFVAYVDNIYIGKEKNVKTLEVIMKICNNINYEIDTQEIDYILDNSSVIKSILENIVNHNENLIKNGQIDRLTSNNLVEYLITLYCDKQGIVIDYSYSIEETREIDTTYVSAIKQYLKELNFSTLTKEEEKELFIMYKNGDLKVRDKLISHNLRLVVYAASRLKNKNLDFEDLVQEGNIGLMIAVEKFNPLMGVKFSTYAMYWIRKIMLIALYKNDLIKLSKHMKLLVNRYKNMVNEYQNSGIEVKDEEIIKKLGITKNDLQNIRMVINNNHIVSIDSNIKEEENFTYSDILADDKANYEEVYFNKEILELIEDMLNIGELSDNESEIIKWRFGLGGYETKTLVEIGKILGLSRERVRQLESLALKKIRSYKDMNVFEMKKVKNKNMQLKEKETQIKSYLKTLSKKEEMCMLYYLGIDTNHGLLKYTTNEYLKTLKQVKNKLIKLGISMDQLLEIKIRNDIKAKKYKELEAIIPNILFGVEGKVVDITQNIIITGFNDLLRNKNFRALVYHCSAKEAVIIALYLGFINKRKYKTSEIAKVFCLDEFKVNQIVKNLLNNYQVLLNSLDEVVTKKNLKLELRRKIY